ncbi:GDP-mannose 4,6-dehydratase [Candidatus Pelagibacter sp.]|nr:GDP-mannose 4,6-dehydratase [Candidatus Pelagibacter sp.]
MKKILILGANSFAGTSFVNYLLKKKYKVFSSSRSSEKKDPFNIFKENINKHNYRFTKIDINKKTDLKKVNTIIVKNKIKTIVDFGSQSMVGQSWETPEDWVRTNCLGKLNLVKELSKIKKIKYVRISTPEVYGNNTKKIKEDDKIIPSTPYAITQATADFFTYAYTKFKGLNSITLRFANFYGPGQQLFRIIPKTIISILKREKLNIHGDGSSLRSFIFPDDFCESIILAIKFGKKNETYNISPSREISIINLVRLICKIMKYDEKKLVVFSKDRIGKDARYMMSSKKANKKLHWKSKISLEEGLKKTIQWHINNFKKLKKLKSNYIHKK